MHEHPNRALSALHDLGYGCDIEVGDDTKENGLGLVGGQPANQGQRSVQ